MPMHDWTRVSAGVYHHFHNTWITELSNALNDKLLPGDYYALGEQRTGEVGPDVLTLRASETTDEDHDAGRGQESNGMVAVAEAPPGVVITQDAAEDARFYLSRQRSVMIRHATGDHVVAVIEIVSPPNKHSRRTLEDFVDKVAAFFNDGIHVLVIDPMSPGSHNPNGIHGAIWDYLLAGKFEAPEDAPLTLVSYAVRHTIKAFIQPISVDSTLVDMPLFLKPEHYVPVPLEMTYMRAWSGVPQRWRDVIVDGSA